MNLLLLLACTGYKPVDPESEVCESCGGDCLSEVLPESTRNHTSDPVDYADRPPTNGDHAGCWAAWGNHSEELPDENWVHNLEHGAVVFLWNCPEGCDAEVTELVEYAETLPTGRWIVTPYSLMDWPFAAVSWSHRLLLGCFDLPAMQAFYEENVGHAPEDSLSDPDEGCM